MTLLDVLQVIVPILAGALGFYFFRRTAPAKYTDEELAIPEEVLEAKFKKWDYVSYAILGSTWAMLTVSSTYLLILLAKYQKSRFEAEAAEFIFVPGLTTFGELLDTWGVLGWLGSLMPAAYLTGFIMARILGDRYAGFALYHKKKWDVEEKRIMLPMTIVITLGVIVMAGLSFDNYVVYGEEGMIANRFFSFREEIHTYDGVQQIIASNKYEDRIGSTHESWRFIVNFDDGSIWYSLWNPGYFSDEETKAIADFVSNQSGVPITHVELLTQDMK
jgi:hypothetical protein